MRTKVQSVLLAAMLLVSLVAGAGVATVAAQDATETPETDQTDEPNDSDDNGTEADEPAATSDRVNVMLDGAPNGLQTYSMTVEVSNETNASIEDVEGGLVSAAKLQVIEQTDESITFRAADLGNAVRPFDDARALATVNLSAAVSAEAVSVTVDQLTDDAGAQMNASSVLLRLEGQLFVEPLPGSAGEAPPTDPDDNGLYEDVDGDGDADFDDAISLSFVDHDALSEDQQAALDFNGDGSLSFADSIELAFQA